MIKKELLLLFCILLIPLTFAWDDCNIHEGACEYPGDCTRYLDTNSDGICDHSESFEEIAKLDEKQSNNGIINLSKNFSNSKYNLLPISLFTILLYLITIFLSKKGKIKLMTHRKIWNMVLLITFLVSGILGLVLILKIDTKIDLLSSINSMFWHVEAGIVMTIVSFFHIAWHWKYFKNIIKIKK